MPKRNLGLLIYLLAFLSVLPGPPEGFVCGRCDQVSIFKGRGNSSSCHQTTDVSHVSQHVGINVAAELEERLKTLLIEGKCYIQM